MTEAIGGGLWRRFEAVARELADLPALVHGDRQVTFSELHQMALAAAGELARRGLGPHGRCLIWAGNSLNLAATILATWRLGGIIALVNDEAPPSHFAHAASITVPAVVIVDALAAAEKAAAIVSCPVVTLPFEFADAGGAVPPAHIHDHEPASILFTSGSSGPPKGVTQSHANLLAGCRMVAERLELRTDDRILCPIPWAFDYGYGQLLSTVLLGVTQVLPEVRNPFGICAAITAHRPTVLAGLPSLFALLIRGVSPIRETDLGSLRLVTNTGGKIAPAIFAEMAEIFAHCAVSLNYGMTETYRSAGLPTALASSNPSSVGLAYPGVSIVVIREDGSEAAADEVGEIVHRGTGVFLGYWGAPEATAKVRRPDPLWSHEEVPAPMAVFSGDLGWKDADGLLYVKGRRDRLIKSMGVRVSPDEIETIIRRSGLVQDVAVVGVPHEMIGEMVVAAITLPNGVDDPVRALKIFARNEMSQHMQPREYRILDAFPLTPNGKPDFGRLRTMLGAAE